MIHSYDVGPVDTDDHDDSLQVTVYRGADVAVGEATGTWRESASKMLCCFNSASAYLQRTVQSQSDFWGGTTALHAVARRFSRDLLGPISQDCSGRLTVVLDLDGAISAVSCCAPHGAKHNLLSTPAECVMCRDSCSLKLHSY